MSERTNWKSMPRPDAGRIRDVVEDEANIAAFRELVYQLRIDAGLTQAELAQRMGTTQSAIARMENGGTRPTLETLERVAGAGDQELAVVVGTRLIENRLIAKMVRSGHALVPKASWRAYSACVMVDRYTNWTEQTDFPDGFADCGALQRSRRTVRTVVITFFCQGEGREFESRHPLQETPAQRPHQGR